jgi:hypothetical protein
MISAVSVTDPIMRTVRFAVPRSSAVTTSTLNRPTAA